MRGSTMELPGYDVLAVLDDRNRIRWIAGSAREILGQPALALIAPEDRDRIGELIERAKIDESIEVQYRTIFDQRWAATISALDHVLTIGRATMLPEVADRRVRIVRPSKEWDPRSPSDVPTDFVVEDQRAGLMSSEWVRQFNSRMLREQAGFWAVVVKIESVTQTVTRFTPATALAGVDGD